MKKPHWTQTPEGKQKMAEVQRKAWATKHAKMKQAAKHIVKIAKKGKAKKTQRIITRDAVSVVINGWRITLGKDEVKIDHE